MVSGIALFVIGALLVPGGALLPTHSSPIAIAVITSGSLMATVGASTGLLPIRWTEIKWGPLTGVIDTDEADFKRFYHDQQDELQKFAFLMCGDAPRAARLVREASAWTRGQWRTGASADPLGATLRALLRQAENPGLLELFVTAGAKQSPTEPLEASTDQVPRATLDALAQLPFRARAAVALHVVYNLSTERMAEVLELPEPEAHEDLEGAIKHLRPLIATGG